MAFGSVYAVFVVLVVLADLGELAGVLTWVFSLPCCSVSVGVRAFWVCGVAGSKDGLRTDIFDNNFDVVAGGE